MLSCRSFQHWYGGLTSGLWLCLNLSRFCCVVPVNQTAFCIWLWDCLVTGLILITTVFYFLSLLGPTLKPNIQRFSKSRCKCLITKCHQETPSKGFNNRAPRSRGHPLGENKHMWPSMWGKKIKNPFKIWHETSSANTEEICSDHSRAESSRNFQGPLVQKEVQICVISY